MSSSTLKTIYEVTAAQMSCLCTIVLRATKTFEVGDLVGQSITLLFIRRPAYEMKKTLDLGLPESEKQLKIGSWV